MPAHRTASFAFRLLSISISAVTLVAALPMRPAAAAVVARTVAARTGGDRAVDAPPRADAPPSAGKTVALMRFTGDSMSAKLRADVQSGLAAAGYEVTTVALDVSNASKRVKCKGEPSGDACLAALGKWLNNSPKTAADFIVFGSVDSGPAKQASVVLYSVGDNVRVKTLRPMLGTTDLILPLTFPAAVSTALDHHRSLPEPPTAEEQQSLAALDEPEKTPEELAAETQEVEKAAREAAELASGQAATISEEVDVDLRNDFDAFCRTGKRIKRESRDDPKDLRPKCQRGAFWGYWQPRAFVALALTGAAAVGTIAFYSAALAARGPYSDAVDAVDAYEEAAGGDPTTDPNFAGDGEYVRLATEVSETGTTMQRRAVLGDVFLGGTVLLGGVLGIIIFQDRRDAKYYIREEKALRSVADFQLAPIVTRDTRGVGMRFRF